MPTVAALELTIQAHNLLATSALINQVKVHCNACDEHLATVKNEWIRLTTKYARPSQPGPNPGVVISDLNRVVLKMGPAAGCTVSEVTCKRCRTIVGAYFRETATPKTQHLVNEHFYKLSHVTMKSNLRPIGPKFTSEPVMVVISSDAAEEDPGALDLNNKPKENEEVTDKDTTNLNTEVSNRSKDEMEQDGMREGRMEEDGMGEDINGSNVYDSVYRSRGKIASLWHVKTDNRTTRQLVTDPQSRIGADERVDDLLAHIETLETQATTNQATIVSQQATISSQQDIINRLLQQRP